MKVREIGVSEMPKKRQGVKIRVSKHDALADQVRRLPVGRLLACDCEDRREACTVAAAFNTALAKKRRPGLHAAIRGNTVYISRVSDRPDDDARLEKMAEEHYDRLSGASEPDEPEEPCESQQQSTTTE